MTGQSIQVSGSINIDGVQTEFAVSRTDVDGLSASQWGAERETLGDRVDLLDGIEQAVREWCLNRDVLCDPANLAEFLQAEEDRSR